MSDVAPAQDADLTERFQDRVRTASGPLCLRGGGTKDFYGGRPQGETLDTRGHQGILSYQPEELVIRARCGTLLSHLVDVLAEHGQQLPFEPPAFGAGATFGGVVASGLSGPARPYRGSVRDAVLGVVCLNGRGERLRFGGEVMKNVAGYDVSRLMTGALGTLGLILDAAVKVVPRPARTCTCVFEMTAQEALTAMTEWQQKALPITGLAYTDAKLYLRLAGTEQGVSATRQRLGGEEDQSLEGFWTELREQSLEFFQHSDHPRLWRLSVPAATPLLDLPGTWLLDWGGAQRWLVTDQAAAKVRETAGENAGHATLFRGVEGDTDVFHPLAAAAETIHRQLKSAFDPKGLFNPGRMYPQW